MIGYNVKQDIIHCEHNRNEFLQGGSNVLQETQGAGARD